MSDAARFIQWRLSPHEQFVAWWKLRETAAHLIGFMA